MSEQTGTEVAGAVVLDEVQEAGTRKTGACKHATIADFLAMHADFSPPPPVKDYLDRLYRLARKERVKTTRGSPDVSFYTHPERKKGGSSGKTLGIIRKVEKGVALGEEGGAGGKRRDAAVAVPSAPRAHPSLRHKARVILLALELNQDLADEVFCVALADIGYLKEENQRLREENQAL